LTVDPKIAERMEKAKKLGLEAPEIRVALYERKLDEMICPLMKERCTSKCVFRHGNVCLIAEYLKKRVEKR